MTFHERKKLRTEYYFQKEFKKKLIVCTACNGTGYYDSANNPKCSACNGTGKVKEIWIKEILLRKLRSQSCYVSSILNNWLF